MLEKPAEQIFDVIRYFGDRGRIFNVHFRNIRGHRDDLQETFPDEGDVDMRRALLGTRTWSCRTTCRSTRTILPDARLSPFATATCGDCCNPFDRPPLDIALFGNETQFCQGTIVGS